MGRNLPVVSAFNPRLNNFQIYYMPDILFDDIRIEREKRFYMFQFPQPFRMFSSAPYGGGTGKSERYINRTVERNYSRNPQEEIPEFLAGNSISKENTCVTLTACNIMNADIVSSDDGEFPIMLSVTAGISNALSIGSSGFERPGTINIALISDADLDGSSALNLFSGLTEAKSQAMNDMGIKDRTTGKRAPGTSTDTVSIFLSGSGRHSAYGGRLTEIGRAASLMVYDSVIRCLSNDCTEGMQ